MTRPHPMHWLSERSRAGLQELPSNAAWLLSRALKPAESAGSAAETAASGTRDRARKVRASVVDAVPVGGDSVETRLKRARAAAERAQEAEAEAVAAARESKQRADHAKQVNEHGRTRVTEVKRETSRAVDQRVAEVRRAADEQVERERAAARAKADEQLQKVQSETADETQQAQRDAEAAQERAEELVAEATHRLAEARQLADEAREVARAAAEEAHRQAQQLAESAEQEARQTDAKVEAAERIRDDARGTAQDTARQLGRDDRFDGDLNSLNKPELLDLAATIDIEGRTNLTKAELVTAINKASRATR